MLADQKKDINKQAQPKIQQIIANLNQTLQNDIQELVSLENEYKSTPENKRIKLNLLDKKTFYSEVLVALYNIDTKINSGGTKCNFDEVSTHWNDLQNFSAYTEIQEQGNASNSLIALNESLTKISNELQRINNTDKDACTALNKVLESDLVELEKLTKTINIKR
jgi:hypothetical protein